MRARLDKERGLDIGYRHKDLTRCRTIVFFERNRLNIVLRLAPLAPPTIEEIFQPLYFVRDFIEILCAPDMPEDQKRQIMDSLKGEVGKLVDKLKEHFRVDK